MPNQRVAIGSHDTRIKGKLYTDNSVTSWFTGRWMHGPHHRAQALRMQTRKKSIMETFHRITASSHCGHLKTQAISGWQSCLNLAASLTTTLRLGWTLPALNSEQYKTSYLYCKLRFAEWCQPASLCERDDVGSGGVARLWNRGGPKPSTKQNSEP